jgi:predicted enzyme related to lactoylglutathione lyase
LEAARARLDSNRTKAQPAGATIVMPKSTITGVGTLFFFQDTEGNIAGAMQYDEQAE